MAITDKGKKGPISASERKKQVDAANIRAKKVDISAMNKKNAAKIAKMRAEAAKKKMKKKVTSAGSMAGLYAKQRGSKFIAEHTVKKGDTLSAIAKKYYGSATKPLWEVIQKANNIKDANLIYPGQVFKIPKLPPGFKK